MCSLSQFSPSLCLCLFLSLFLSSERFTQILTIKHVNRTFALPLSSVSQCSLSVTMSLFLFDIIEIHPNLDDQTCQQNICLSFFLSFSVLPVRFLSSERLNQVLALKDVNMTFAHLFLSILPSLLSVCLSVCLSFSHIISMEAYPLRMRFLFGDLEAGKEATEFVNITN